MLIRIASLFLCIFILCFSVLGFGGEVDYERLVGKWYTEAKHSSGAIVSVKVELTEDKKFSFQSYIDGAVNGSFDGTYEIVGNELIWTYVNSNKQLPPNFKDTDIILSVEKDKYTYKSKRSGKTGFYKRIQ